MTDSPGLNTRSAWHGVEFLRLFRQEDMEQIKALTLDPELHGGTILLQLCGALISVLRDELHVDVDATFERVLIAVKTAMADTEDQQEVFLDELLRDALEEERRPD